MKQLVLFIMLFCVFVVGCGGNDVVSDVSETFDYEIELLGEPVLIVPDETDDFMQAEFYGVDESVSDRLADAKTLEYKAAVYMGDNLEFTMFIQLRNLDIGCPDIRYSEEGTNYIYLVSYTEQKCWLREDDTFVLESEGDAFLKSYEMTLLEEKMYLRAISKWDGESLIIVPETPYGSSVVVYDINIGANINSSVFLPE